MRPLGKAIIFTVIFAVLCTRLAAQTNPVPFISKPLAPSAALPGAQGFTLTVNGAGFVQGSIVNWNGSARVTTFVSPARLTAAILASDLATARRRLIGRRLIWSHHFHDNALTHPKGRWQLIDNRSTSRHDRRGFQPKWYSQSGRCESPMSTTSTVCAVTFRHRDPARGFPVSD